MTAEDAKRVADAWIRMTVSAAEFERGLVKMTRAWEGLGLHLKAMYPGMPYSGPNLWDRSQMRAAPQDTDAD